MAQIYRRPNSPYWWGKFMLGGKLHRFSTGKANRAEASTELSRKMAEARGETSADYYLERLLVAINALPAKRQQELRQTIARMMVADRTARIALADAWNVWLSLPRNRMPSENTLVGYTAIWKRFSKWAATLEPPRKFLDEFTVSLAEDYAGDLANGGFSSRSYNAHLTFLKAMFHVLRNRAGLSENVWRDIPRAEGASRGRRELTVKEMTDVITKAPADLQTLLLIGAYTGMRLADACLLRWDSINFDDGIIDYEPLKTARKGKRIRVPMSPHLSARLKNIQRTAPEGEPFVLPAIARQYKAERASVSVQIQAHFANCGIATQEVPPVGSKVTRAVCRVGFHSLRHSFVSLCAANRVPQVAVMEMVGHGSPAMTRLYSHAGDEQKRDAVELLPALLSAGGTRKRKKSPAAQPHERPAPESVLAASPSSQ